MSVSHEWNMSASEHLRSKSKGRTCASCMSFPCSLYPIISIIYIPYNLGITCSASPVDQVTTPRVNAPFTSTTEIDSLGDVDHLYRLLKYARISCLFLVNFRKRYRTNTMVEGSI